jgi:hypothetical protein
LTPNSTGSPLETVDFMNNPAAQLDADIRNAVNAAFKGKVHPAIAYTILGLAQDEVANVIRRTNQDINRAETAQTAEQIIESGKGQKPAGN